MLNKWMPAMSAYKNTLSVPVSDPPSKGIARMREIAVAILADPVLEDNPTQARARTAATELLAGTLP